MSIELLVLVNVMDTTDFILVDVTGVTATGTGVLVMTEDDAVENDVVDNSDVVADASRPPVLQREFLKQK